MFLPVYTLPHYRRVSKNIQNRFLEEHPMNETHAELDTTPTHEGDTTPLNPLHIFIFLSFFCIWLGGFTKNQIYRIYTFLKGNKIEEDLK
tara:strand:- start:1647 stop:1916 length:270 start_codon:yes stop_codon:yes gene_type:complete